jgi:hypothetical protein
MYEPEEIASRFMTAEDKKIRETDQAERFQLARDLAVNPAMDDELEIEFAWVHARVNHLCTRQVSDRAVELFQVAKLEPPHVHLYQAGALGCWPPRRAGRTPSRRRADAGGRERAQTRCKARR